MEIPEEKKKVVVLINRFRIVGNICLYPGVGLSDILNGGEQAFISIEDAEIYSLVDGKLLQSVPSLWLNRKSIDFLFPEA
ncbi:MAG: hypothetical protein PHO53_06245 [Actinomycetota bacterium]|nr:hypothetical protein [Actinomycetota bacterium]